MTVCIYRDIYTVQLYIIDLTQRGCHTLRLIGLRLAGFWRAFRISGGGVETPNLPPRYATAHTHETLESKAANPGILCD